MTYAEYRAQRIAERDLPRAPTAWRIEGRRRVVNDRSRRRQYEKRQDGIADRDPTFWMLCAVRNGYSRPGECWVRRSRT